MAKKFLMALTAIVASCLSCDMVSVSAEPLNEIECGQLMDKINEVFTADLEGEDLESFNADHARGRAESVRECVEDPAWDRRGFQCAMAASSEAGLKSCILRLP